MCLEKGSLSIVLETPRKYFDTLSIAQKNA